MQKYPMSSQARELRHHFFERRESGAHPDRQLQRVNLFEIGGSRTSAGERPGSRESKERGLMGRDPLSFSSVRADRA